MKLLCVSQYYWPEPFNVSEICEQLVENGHDVTVLTGLPNYPEGRIYPEYCNKARLCEMHNGVRILRCRIIPRYNGLVGRIGNYYSFAYSGSLVAKKIRERYDAVIAFQFSPIMSVKPAISFSKKSRVPLLLYAIDLWPESLLAGGIAKDSIVYRHYAKVSARIYGAADCLAITSPQFEQYISGLAGSSVEATYLPQFAEDIFMSSNQSVPSGYSDGKINLTFAGNVGAAQSVATIIHAAALLQDSNLLFHIVGSGSDLERCKLLAQDLGVDNVVFHGRHSLDEMPAYYAASDAMLVTFSDNPTLGLTLPRKIQSYLAASKPVLGAVVGEARRVIEDAACGYCCAAEDEKSFSEICLQFSRMDAEERFALGKNARAYYQMNYSRELFFQKLEDILTSIKEA